jgi:hypothetical protein
MQHHGAVFADGVEHHRTLGLRDDLAQDLDALGFEPLQVIQGHGLRVQRSGDAISDAETHRRSESASGSTALRVSSGESRSGAIGLLRIIDYSVLSSGHDSTRRVDF